MSWVTVGAAAEATDTPLEGVRWLIGAGFLAAFTDTDGVTWVDPDDVRRQRAGLNDAPVADTLRNVADPWERAGVALRVMQALQSEIADLNDVLVGAVAELLDTGHEVVEIAERLACEPDALPVPGAAGAEGSGAAADEAAAPDEGDVSATGRDESPAGGDESAAGGAIDRSVGDAQEPAGPEAPAVGDAQEPAGPEELAVGDAEESAGPEALAVGRPTGERVRDDEVEGAVEPADPSPQVEVEGSSGVEGGVEPEVAGGVSAEPLADLSPDRPGPTRPGFRRHEVAPDADLTGPTPMAEPVTALDRTDAEAVDHQHGEDAQHTRGVDAGAEMEETLTGAVVVDDLVDAEPGAEVELDEEVGAAVLEFRRAAGDDQPSAPWPVPSPPRPAAGGTGRTGRTGPAAVGQPPSESEETMPTDEDEGPGIGWGPIDVSAIARTVTTEVGAIAHTVTSVVGRVLSALGWR